VVLLAVTDGPGSSADWVLPNITVVVAEATPASDEDDASLDVAIWASVGGAASLVLGACPRRVCPKDNETFGWRWLRHPCLRPGPGPHQPPLLQPGCFFLNAVGGGSGWCVGLLVGTCILRGQLRSALRRRAGAEHGAVLAITQGVSPPRTPNPAAVHPLPIEGTRPLPIDVPPERGAQASPSKPDAGMVQYV
jgi:hypothetical protein